MLQIAQFKRSTLICHAAVQELAYHEVQHRSSSEMTGPKFTETHQVILLQVFGSSFVDRNLLDIDDFI